MSRILRSGPLTAAVAWTALFIALGGAVFATTQLPRNSVGSGAIRHCAITNDKLARNAVTGSKVKPGSLDGSDIDLSRLGTVPSAATCAEAAVAATARALDEVTYVTAVVNVPPADDAASGVASSTARCPAGQKVLGGGADVASDADQIVNDSHPAGNAAWRALGLNSDTEPQTMTVWAICSAVRSGVSATDASARSR